ncbi:response regulator transcription factor [Tsukamurella serpentis]
MTGAAPLVLVYSSNARHRAEIVAALGSRPAAGGPVIEIVQAATAPSVLALLAADPFALAVLDGESSPVGGLGLARQVRDEVDPCPPLLVITARSADAWLARWSHADASVSHPLDPFELAAAAARLLTPAP